MPSKDSAVARAVRVLIYTVIPTFIALTADPTVVGDVQKYAPWLLPVIVTGAPIVSLIYNILRKDVVNWK